MSQEIRQAVIMAAGLGTRLRPLTESVPKPLLPVAGRPILDWSLERLPAEIEEVILVVGYLKESIMERFGAEWQGRRIRYAVQDELKGTGHAVHCCRPLLNERFLVMNGDDLYRQEDITAMMRHPLAILVKEDSSSGRFGSLRTDGQGRLAGIEEGAKSDGPALVNTGLYALDRRFFDYDLVPIKQGREFGLPQTLVSMAQDHPVAVVPASFWLPIGYPEDLQKATEVLSAEAESRRP